MPSSSVIEEFSLGDDMFPESCPFRLFVATFTLDGADSVFNLLLVAFRQAFLFTGALVMCGFLCLCVGAPVSLFLLPLVAEFLRFYVFSGSYDSLGQLLETSLLFSRRGAVS